MMFKMIMLDEQQHLHLLESSYRIKDHVSTQWQTYDIFLNLS